MKKNYAKVGRIVTRTIEECSEVIHILCKVERFGWNDLHPIHKTLNRVLVKQEIKDLRNCLDELEKTWLKTEEEVELMDLT